MRRNERYELEQQFGVFRLEDLPPTSAVMMKILVELRSITELLQAIVSKETKA